MFFIAGQDSYGKVDEVPGVGHVETRFDHLYFLPLLPQGSELVLACDRDGRSRVAIPTSFKSVLVAWARALTGVGLFLAPLVAWVCAGPLAACATIAAAVGLLALLCLHPRLRFASFARARRLIEEAGLGPHALVEAGLGLGRIAPGEALEQLRRLAPRPAEPAWLTKLIRGELERPPQPLVARATVSRTRARGVTL